MAKTEADLEEKPSRQRTLRILELVRPHRGRFALGSLFLLAGSGIGLAYPRAIKYA
ncbi:MAG: hypothetical protein ACI9KE_003724, partial [Polyangiales bacterium]